MGGVILFLAWGQVPIHRLELTNPLYVDVQYCQNIPLYKPERIVLREDHLLCFQVSVLTGPTGLSICHGAVVVSYKGSRKKNLPLVARPIRPYPPPPTPRLKLNGHRTCFLMARPLTPPPFSISLCKLARTKTVVWDIGPLCKLARLKDISCKRYWTFM